MTDEIPPAPRVAPPPALSRENRRAENLRANLLRRKEQARERAASSETSVPPSPSTYEDEV